MVTVINSGRMLRSKCMWGCGLSGSALCIPCGEAYAWKVLHNWCARGPGGTYVIPACVHAYNKASALAPNLQARADAIGNGMVSAF